MRYTSARKKFCCFSLKFRYLSILRTFNGCPWSVRVRIYLQLDCCFNFEKVLQLLAFNQCKSVFAHWKVEADWEFYDYIVKLAIKSPKVGRCSCTHAGVGQNNKLQWAELKKMVSAARKKLECCTKKVGVLHKKKVLTANKRRGCSMHAVNWLFSSSNGFGMEQSDSCKRYKDCEGMSNIYILAIQAH